MLALAGCRPVVIISPYDSDIDRGLQDFKQKLTTVVVDAGNHSKAPEGSFDSFKQRYSELEIQLVMMRDRAVVLEANDVNCAIPAAARSLVSKFPHGKELLALESAPPAAAGGAAPNKDADPVPINALAIGKNKSLTAATGCMTRLIDNIAGQLTSIESLHHDPQMCADPKDPARTCLRPALAVDALAIASNSLDAALAVQIYKKQSEDGT